jgi:hypothetical protein
MNKKIAGISVALLVLFVVGTVFAATVAGNTYLLPGTDYRITCESSGFFNLTAGGNHYSSAGRWKLTGDEVLLEFYRNEKLGSLSGVSFFLTILPNGNLDGGDGIWRKR